MTAPAQRKVLLLWGMMGSGKSTVGRALAALVDARFIDLDQVVVESAGQRIASIFDEHGEAHFRALEQRSLADLLAMTTKPLAAPTVVALGGGTLIHEPTRTRALNETFVVCLRADVETLLSRAHGSDRPLLKDGARKAMSNLLKQRNKAYEQAHLRVSTDDQSVESIAERLAGQWIGARVGAS